MDVVDFMDADNYHHDGPGRSFPLNMGVNQNNINNSHHYQLNQHHQHHHHNHATGSYESEEWDSYAPIDVCHSQDEVDGYDSADSHENIIAHEQANSYLVTSPPEWEEGETGMVQIQPPTFGFSNNSSPFFGSSQTHVFNHQWIQQEDQGQEEKASDGRDPSRIYIQAVRGQQKSQRAFNSSRSQQQEAKPFLGFLMNDGRVYRKRDVTGTFKNDWEDWGERNEIEEFDWNLRNTKCGRRES